MRSIRPPTFGAALPASVLAAATLLGAGAQANRFAGALAERRHPPTGSLIDVDGVPLHVHAEGRGRALLMIHGNGAMVQDFLSSPLHRMLVRRFRVYLVDRPGFGHSPRPDGRAFGPDDQGRLFHRLARRLGLQRPVVVGHSWGTLPALSMAIDYPGAVGALVLASGYYFPTDRLGDRMTAAPRLPILGDLVRSAVSPTLARVLWPSAVRKVFAPNPVTEGFDQGFPRDLALRPSQLRAVAEDTRAMRPGARRILARLPSLAVPLVVVAGSADTIVDTARHSARLARKVPGARLHLVSDAGHMVHHVAPERVLAAIEEADRLAP